MQMLLFRSSSLLAEYPWLLSRSVSTCPRSVLTHYPKLAELVLWEESLVSTLLQAVSTHYPELTIGLLGTGSSVDTT
ncbi:hypothetical protein Taro_056229 [Colocasia esculenta]|uniref:Uncharacterized protein n=1 Tax=Colocasia esculenta TaxID=4460 RepID=A0A843XV59_COLES|nr:hypothetical protein [Colocasia esculenta]